MFEVLKPGLETSVQDFPGRIGYWEQGFPFSGPMDFWSFNLANLLVGNTPMQRVLNVNLRARKYFLGAIL